LLKAGERLFGWPDVAGGVLGEGWVAFCEVGLREGVGEAGVTVDIVGAFEGVVLATLQLFFAAGPADEPFGVWVFEVFWAVLAAPYIRERCRLTESLLREVGEVGGVGEEVAAHVGEGSR
jgi:hypothetical protein